MMKTNIRKHFDALSVFIIAVIIITLITFSLRADFKSGEESRQAFENRLLQKIIVGNSLTENASKVIVHNQGVIIKNDKIDNHNKEIIIGNQRMFSKYGMPDNGDDTNFTTPNIRTDFQRTSTDYWINYTK